MATTNVISMLSFNVLAPSWADPSYYPNVAEKWLIPSGKRIERTVKYIVKRCDDSFDVLDAMAFQETEEMFHTILHGAITTKYHYARANHDDTYWSKHAVASNGRSTLFMSNGVSLALRRDRYDDVSYYDIALGTGNHCVVALARHRASQCTVCFASVHFDSDKSWRRDVEIRNFTNAIESLTDTRRTVVVAGDFNATLEDSIVNMTFTRHAFVDVSSALNMVHHERSDRLLEVKSSGERHHVMVKTPRYIQAKPLHFLVEPITTITTETLRDVVSDALEYFGSDRSPIIATIEIINNSDNNHEE